MNRDAIIEPTQADREAAANLLRQLKIIDNGLTTQTFARHRIEALEAAAKIPQLVANEVASMYPNHQIISERILALIGDKP